MTQTFQGDIVLPGELGEGIGAALSIDHSGMTLTSAGEELGAWGAEECLVQPDRDGTFLLTLGGEDVYFAPSSPGDFAAACTVPIQGRAESTSPKRKAGKRKAGRRKDAASTAQDAPAADAFLLPDVAPRRDPGEDGIVTRGFLGVVVALSLLIGGGAIVAMALV